MRAKTFAKYAKQMPASWLPFADVASAGLPLPRLLHRKTPNWFAPSCKRWSMVGGTTNPKTCVKICVMNCEAAMAFLKKSTVTCCCVCVAP